MATYYVDADRPDDLGNGLSFAAAWKTVAKVNATSFAPGDIILFDSDEWAETLNPATSGTAGNPITFGRYNASGARPIFRAAASGRPEAITLVAGRSYITLSFLRCVGGDLTQADALLESDSVTNIAEDCTFDGEGAADSCVGGSITLRRFFITGARDDGFTQHQTDTSILEDGEITGCTQGINNSGTNMTLTLTRVNIHDNGTAEIANLDNTTATVTRCRIKGKAKLFDGSLLPVTFNYCQFDGSNGSDAVSPELNTSSLTTFNNCTIWANGKGKMAIQNAACNFVNTILANWNVAANLTSGGTFNKNFCLSYNVASGTVTADTNAITPADPLFANPSAGNFRLGIGSPAIGVGTVLGVSAVDLAGNPVRNPPSLGAYESATTINAATLNATTLSIA